MTGEEFLHFVGALYGVDENRRKQKIQELFLFPIDGSEMDDFDGYSRGNKQKFSILAAPAPRTETPSLIDEPIVGLDPESAPRRQGYLHWIRRTGRFSVLSRIHFRSLKPSRIVSVSSSTESSSRQEVSRRSVNAHSRTHPASLETIYNIITA